MANRNHPFWRVLETALIVTGLACITYGMVVMGTHGADVAEGVHAGLDGKDLAGGAALLGGGKLAWPLVSKLMARLEGADDDYDPDGEDDR